MKPRQAIHVVGKIIALSRANQGPLTASRRLFGHCRAANASKCLALEQVIDQLSGTGGAVMWRVAWKEIVEVLWLASMITGLSLFSLAVAGAAVLASG